jgi:hypothetical protein
LFGTADASGDLLREGGQSANFSAVRRVSEGRWFGGDGINSSVSGKLPLVQDVANRAQHAEARPELRVASPATCVGVGRCGDEVTILSTLCSLLKTECYKKRVFPDPVTFVTSLRLRAGGSATFKSGPGALHLREPLGTQWLYGTVFSI